MALTRNVLATCSDCDTTFEGIIVFGLMENEYPSADGGVIDECASHHVNRSMEERGLKGKHDRYVVREGGKRLGDMNVTTLAGPVLFNVYDDELSREIDGLIKPGGEIGY